MSKNSILRKVTRSIVTLMFFAMLFGCHTSGPSIIADQYAAILEIDFPNELVHGETYFVPVKVSTPTTCHTFKVFEEIIRDQEYRVTAMVVYQETGNCELTLETPYETDFEFKVEREDRYEFLFFRGFNEDDEPQYFRFNRDVMMP